MVVGQVVYCLLWGRLSLPKGYTVVAAVRAGPGRRGSCGDGCRSHLQCGAGASPGTRPLSQTVQCVLFAFPGTERDKCLHPLDVTTLNWTYLLSSILIGSIYFKILEILTFRATQCNGLTKRPVGSFLTGAGLALPAVVLGGKRVNNLSLN